MTSDSLCRSAQNFITYMRHHIEVSHSQSAAWRVCLSPSKYHSLGVMLSGFFTDEQLCAIRDASVSCCEGWIAWARETGATTDALWLDLLLAKIEKANLNTIPDIAALEQQKAKPHDALRQSISSYIEGYKESLLIPEPEELPSRLEAYRKSFLSMVVKPIDQSGTERSTVLDEVL